MVFTDFVIICFGVCILFSILKKTQNEQKTFSLDTMVCIKGIFAIMIVLFHLSQRIECGFLFILIGDTGYLSVAIFFFISGYGMYKHVIQSGGGYCRSIISKRLPRVILPWVIASLIYAIYWASEGGVEKIIQICDNHKNGYLLITNSWYVIAISIFYIVFFFAFRYCKNNYKAGILFSFIGILTYIVIAYLIGLGGWWFYSSFAFIVGMLWCEKEVAINKIEGKNYVLFIFFWAVIFIIGYILRFFNSNELHSAIVYNIALLISSAGFVGFVFSILNRVSLNNQLWRFIGKISYEIYLLHELIYNILRNNKLGIYIQSDFLYVIYTLIISIIFAYIFNLLITKKIVFKIFQ